MSANQNLVTVKVNIPGDAENREATFPVSDENIEGFINYLGKCKIEGFNLRTLVARNKYGAGGMPVEAKRAQLLAKLAALDAAEESAA